MILAAQQYRDRATAGRFLGRQLVRYANRRDILVLALPRGGVPVGLEVATYLNAPLDLMLVRPLMVTHPAAHMVGSVASGGIHVLDELAIEQAELSAGRLKQIVARESAELEHQQVLYRGNRRRLEITDRIVILVDDGLGANSAMHTAVIAVHQQRPAWLVVAAPVGSQETCDELAAEVHEVICPLRPEPFESVDLWYDHFAPTSDEMVCRCMRQAATRPLR